MILIQYSSRNYVPPVHNGSKVVLFIQYSLIKIATHLLLANAGKWELKVLIFKGNISSGGNFKVSLVCSYREKIPNRNYVFRRMSSQVCQSDKGNHSSLYSIPSSKNCNST